VSEQALAGDVLQRTARVERNVPARPLPVVRPSAPARPSADAPITVQAQGQEDQPGESAQEQAPRAGSPTAQQIADRVYEMLRGDLRIERERTRR